MCPRLHACGALPGPRRCLRAPSCTHRNMLFVPCDSAAVGDTCIVYVQCRDVICCPCKGPQVPALTDQVKYAHPSARGSNLLHACALGLQAGVVITGRLQRIVMQEMPGPELAF